MAGRKAAVVTFKRCPKCHGIGKVTCDGRDHIRQKYLAWAWKLHMKPVLYHGKQDVLGIAVAGINPGGWAFLDIYVALSNDHCGMTHHDERLGTYLYIRRRRKRGTKLEFQNFYAIECRGPEMGKVEPLDIWPQHLMLLPSGYELDDGSLSMLISGAKDGKKEA